MLRSHGAQDLRTRWQQDGAVTTVMRARGGVTVGGVAGGMAVSARTGLCDAHRIDVSDEAERADRLLLCTKGRRRSVFAMAGTNERWGAGEAMPAV